MRKRIDLTQSEIIDAIKEKYGIKFEANVTFLIDLHGSPNVSDGMPVSGTISAISIEGDRYNP